MHSPDNFAQHCLGLLKNRGTSGPTGPTPDKSFKSRDKAGTTECNKVGPLDFHWSPQGTVSGPAKIVENQSLAKPVTTGTSGTTIFNGATTDAVNVDGPAEWHAFLGQLRDGKPIEWMAAARWREVLSDAGNFVCQWGDTAQSLGWSLLDLLGVHSVAPSARVGAWGLILFIHGGSIVALTGDSATIRRPSKSILTYRRRDMSDSVLIHEVPNDTR